MQQGRSTWRQRICWHFKAPIGAGYLNVRVLKLLRRYGLWLFTCSRSFDDPRIWREDKNSDSLPTPFQRAIGVRYVGRRSSRYPNSKGGYCDNRLSGPPKSIPLLLKGFFSPGPVSPPKLALVPGHRAILRRSKGYAILWAPHIRFISVGGFAHFVGSVLVNETTKP